MLREPRISLESHSKEQEEAELDFTYADILPAHLLTNMPGGDPVDVTVPLGSWAPAQGPTLPQLPTFLAPPLHTFRY